MSSPAASLIRFSRRGLLAGLASWSCSKDRPKPAASQQRLISISPNTSETLYALGVGDRLVGRSKFCNYPNKIKRLPSVGGYVDPSFEAILGLAPTLVTGARGPSGKGLVGRLEARGIATYFPSTESFDEIAAMIIGLGKRTSASEAARRVVEAMERERDAVRRATKARKAPRALLLFGLKPVVVAGPKSFADEMVRLANATNVVESGPKYPTLGMERVIALDPDVIVDATNAALHDGRGVNAEMPGWKELRAVKSGRLVSLSDERVLRPGPRISQGLRLLAKALHPGAL